MAESAAEFLPAVVERIVRNFKPDRIILFGSFARGEAGPDSDLDLLVVLPEVHHRRDQAVAIRQALADLPVSKDVVVATAEEIERDRHRIGSIIGPALSEGRVLYERD
ncbi:MAG: nucleotidyltransferase domain-containing protein [Candidatus Sericytochromatia bacterium]|nr:nucleotidyltransferase domain-containing protein [Candidatus Tanganyikabacteria bacterium]